ncbi:MAG: hypothetical protein E6Q97_27070 [Desulfurellales bacterium]|nr:MAG: hypothetical protein E6Q97_27070 [Desulfurellales bacterium]
MKNYLATLNYMTHIPDGSIYRGSGKFDFMVDDTLPIPIMKEKLVELKENADVIYKKAGETTKIRAELKKEDKPIAKNEDKAKGAKG